MLARPSVSSRVVGCYSLPRRFPSPSRKGDGNSGDSSVPSPMKQPARALSSSSAHYTPSFEDFRLLGLDGLEPQSKRDAVLLEKLWQQMQDSDDLSSPELPTPVTSSEDESAAAAPAAALDTSSSKATTRRRGRTKKVPSVTRSAASAAEILAAPAPELSPAPEQPAEQSEAAAEAETGRGRRRVGRARVRSPSAPALVVSAAAARAPAAAEEERGAAPRGAGSPSSSAPAGAVRMRERVRGRYTRHARSEAPAPSSAPAAALSSATPMDTVVRQAGELCTLSERLGRPPHPELIILSRDWTLFPGQKSVSESRGGSSDAYHNASSPTGDAVSMFLTGMGHTPVLEKGDEAALCRILYDNARVDMAFPDQAHRAPPPTNKTSSFGGPGSSPSTAGSAGDAQGASAGWIHPVAHLEDLSPEAWLKVLEESGCGDPVEALARRRLFSEARALMISHNLRLVISVANRYRNKGLEFADLIPEGIQGLMRALDKFDPDRGFKFSTYAHWWIRQACTRAITEHSRVVRLPVHVADAVAKYKRLSAQLRVQLGRHPEVHEVAHVMGIPLDRLETYIRAARPHRSLEQTLQGGGNKSARGGKDAEASLAEMLIHQDDWENENGAGADVLREEAIREEVSRALEGLDRRERNVLKLRYGMSSLTDHQAMTFTDIGNMHGLTKERIRQIEMRALSKLRRADTKADLESVLFDYRYRTKLWED